MFLHQHVMKDNSSLKETNRYSTVQTLWAATHRPGCVEVLPDL